MNVVIVGSGNVATVLAKVIHKAGHEIVQILGRNENRAKVLANTYNATWGSFKSTPYSNADLYILAVSDNSLSHLDLYQNLGKKIVLHTAGSVSMEVLQDLSENFGILYPLQTLTKGSEDIYSLPFLINGSSDTVKEFVESFAKTLSPNVSYASDQERLKYHIAAVFVNNFTNHLYAIAEDFCSKEEIDFKKLFPLIRETTDKVMKDSPKNVQTGPALREDIYTMGRHLQMLTSQPDIKYLYLKLSESILKFHQKDQQ